MSRITNRLGWGIAGALAIALLTVLGSVIYAGPLDPPGPPAPTYKSLELIPGAWVRVLDSTNGDGQGCNSSRFACVLGGQAVIDLETDLVWQRDGGTTATTWASAVTACYGQLLGGKWGWRLPTFPELMSLASSAPLPVPATGSPFTNIGAGGPGGSYYWTASADPSSAANAWIISWGFAVVTTSRSSGAGGATGRVLCVRAPDSMATD